MTNPDTLAGGVKLEAKALEAARIAYAKASSHEASHFGLPDAITAYIAALPATGAAVNDDMIDAAQAVLLKYVEDRAAIRHALVAALATIPSGGEPVAWIARGYLDQLAEGKDPEAVLWHDAMEATHIPLFASPPKPSEAMVEAIEHIEQLVAICSLLKPHWPGYDYDHVITIAVDEAEQYLSDLSAKAALSGGAK